MTNATQTPSITANGIDYPPAALAYYLRYILDQPISDKHHSAVEHWCGTQNLIIQEMLGSIENELRAALESA